MIGGYLRATSPGSARQVGRAKPSSGANLGFGPAWVLHYNGSTWSPVTVPATPVWASSVSGTDIWALGPSAATVNKPTQVIVAVHWNGSSWRTLALPKLTPVGGQPWVPDGIAALSADQVWVEETVAVNPGSGTAPPGVTLLHWNGTAWAVAARDLKHNYSSGLTPDGQGGFWLTSGSLNQPVTDIVHYTSGQWTRQPAPTVPGSTGEAGDLTLIPGTASVWGTGALTATGSETTQADIIKYGPPPPCRHAWARERPAGARSRARAFTLPTIGGPGFDSTITVGRVTGRWTGRSPGLRRRVCRGRSGLSNPLLDFSAVWIA